MTSMVSFHACADRRAASRAAADLLAERLSADLEHRGSGSLVVSGGTTPIACFDMLSEAALDWARVTVVPSDERWVPADDSNSNEGLIRKHLLRNAAAAARLLPLYRPEFDPARDPDVDSGAAPAVIEQELRALRALTGPFSAVLLGMGADGHFASLFPDFAGLSRALDPAAAERCILLRTAGSPFLRVSLTLSALLQTAQAALLFFG
ncbi:MAG: 6-phosphogluconolactonase, partial [Lysobacterales bacterium]